MKRRRAQGNKEKRNERQSEEATGGEEDMSKKGDRKNEILE